MNRLTVYLNADCVGTLEEDDGSGLRFTYAPEWLEREDAIPLSRSLPLSAESFATKRARPFFGGILPEEGPRAGIAQILGISESNDFAMLERIGGECAGAVSLVPEGQELPPVEKGMHLLIEDELASIIRELPRRPLMAGKEGVRLSLAGAQDKLPVIWNGVAAALPLGNTPSTHIIKPEPHRFSGLAANEAFCMELARRVGLNVAEATTRVIGETPCIIVTRYDREFAPDGAKRLHQEDFCQALGRPPDRKYQQEGGPTVRESVALLREWSTTPVIDLLAFVDALVFNLVIGNADAHGKNYSMLYTRGTRRLAPLYDLVSTIAWPELSTRLAMNIGHANGVTDLNPVHFNRLAKECGLGEPMVRARVEAFVRRIKDTVEAISLNGEHVLPDGASRIPDAVCSRCERLLSG